MSDVKIDILPLFFDYCIDKKYPITVLVGGRNSGKSFFMEQLATINLHNNDNYKMLVVEDVETNIGEGVKNGIENRIDEFHLQPLFKSVKVPAEIKHLNGNNVIFRGYHSEAQQKQVKSLNEITAIWYEEAENITYQQFKALRMQLRGGNKQDRQLFLSLNPINPDGFVANYFFYEQPTKVFERFEDGRPKVFERTVKVEIDKKTIEVPCIVVCTTYKDNPYLTDEQRADIEELKDYDEDKYEMLANCKFVKSQGAFFKEFQRGIHTCEPFIIPRDWQRYRVFDYGLDMLACYWIAVDNQNRAYVYKELYESNLIISEAAQKIKELTTADEHIKTTFAPPDMWNRRQETGKSVAEHFFNNGITLTKASNNREQGWLDLKEWLRVYEDETGQKRANITIFENCNNLIRTLPQLVSNPANPNDIDSKTNHELTHAPDALRYFVAGRPRPFRPKIKKQGIQERFFGEGGDNERRDIQVL